MTRRTSGSRRTFGTIRRLSSGTWQASYVGPDGKRHNASSTFTDKGYAEGWLAAERLLISQGTWTSPERRAADARARSRREHDALTVDEWIEIVISRREKRTRKPLAPTTADLYRKDARLRITGTDLGRTRLADVTRRDVADWWDRITARTPAANARAYQLLRSAMTDAVDDELLAVTPCRLRGVGKPDPVHSAATVEALTAAETLDYLRAVPAQHRVALMLAAWCGLRSGEVRGLRRRDVRPAQRLVRVEQAVSRARTGPHSFGWRIAAPKTGAGRRTVGMPDQLVGPLETWLERTAGDLHVRRRGGDALLFTATDGVSPLSGTVLRDAHLMGREAIGRPDLTLHDLRRTAATLAAQGGATTAELMRMLGHTTAAMAMHYQSAPVRRDLERAGRLSRILEEAEQAERWGA